jgi:hypothetical protein
MENDPKILPEMDIMDNGDDADCNLSVSSSSFTGHSSTKSAQEAKQDEAEKELKDKIAKHEEKAVRKARIIVIGAFITCAIAVSVAVYKFASKADFRSFELEVRAFLEHNTCFLCTSHKAVATATAKTKIAFSDTHVFKFLQTSVSRSR